jgi:hypothetical protein
MSAPLSSTPAREIICADAVSWLETRGCIEGACAVTSLPDVSEVSLTLPLWKGWFQRAVRLVVSSVPDDSAAVFFQSDIKDSGRWIDKGALVMAAAGEAGAQVLFHKLVCRRPPGTLTGGRPGYTHFIAVSRKMRCPDILPIPDIITEPGRALWIRAMGVRAAAQAVRFARDQVGAKLIFDPFCGVGTVPAVANALGLPALGIEKARKRAEQSRLAAVKSVDL